MESSSSISSVLNLEPHLQEIATLELNEDLETRAEKFEQLRNLIKTEQNLHTRLDDEYLIRFLRANFYDINAAFKNIKDYFRMKQKNRALFVKSHPKESERVFLANCHTLLPQRDVYGSPVVLMRLGAWDTRKFEFEEFMTGVTYILEHVQKDANLQVNGLTCVMDMKGLNFSHVRALPPSKIKVCTSLIQECYPVRYRALHVINESVTFHVLFAIAKRFMDSKIVSLMTLHGTDHASLHRHVPAEILPEEFGGKTGPMNSEYARSVSFADPELVEDVKYGYI